MIRYSWPSLALVKIAFIAFALAEDPQFDGDSSRPKPGQRSLVIVIDTTGSMSEEIHQMRNEAKAIVEHAAGLPENPYYNYIFVDFNDPYPGSIMVTTDKDVMFNTLNKVTADGGDYECPELAMQGIQRALGAALYKSPIFVFTDADAEDKHLENEVNRLIQEKQASITFFITEGCAPQAGGYKIYRRLAKRSGGEYYDLTEDDISKVMQFTRDSLNIKRDLVYVENFTSKTKETFVIGDKTADITVSVTGLEPRVDFTDPDNQKVDVTPKIDLKNVRVYKIDNPKPGPWVIDAQAVDSGRLQITEVSPLTFEFGFSKFLPKTIKETFFRPLKGTANYLVVAPLNMLEDDYTFSHVTITTDSTTSRYELREFSPGLFVTDAFLQPDLFKVTIHCKDAKGNEMKRLISTYIEPEIESKPSVTIIEPKLNVLQYGEILLKCTAKSFSEMTVKWIKEGIVLKEIKADQSFELDHLIPMASLNDNGDYTCEASNSMGKIDIKISVTVQPQSQPLPKVTVYPEAKQISQKDALRIKCIIKYPYDSIYWTFKQMSIESETGNSETSLTTDYVEADHTLVIPVVTKNNAGTYTCVAKAQNTEVKDSVDIAVKYESIITDSAEEALVASIGSTTKLTCHAHGEPKPDIQWYFVEHGNKRQKLPRFIDTLMIDNLHFTDDGIYECEVFNGVGKMQKRIINLRVTAYDPPILISVAKTGETKTLVCECKQCLPMTSYTYTWTFNDIPIEITNLTNVQVESPKSNNDHLKTTLTIDHVGHANQGVYKCELKSDLDSVSHKTVVNILTKPKIQQIFVANSKIGDNGESIVQENQILTLDCQQTVDMLPTFFWFKDELRISNERYLKLGVATYDDSGVYRCEISNSKGLDTKSITVQVHGYPRIVSEFPKKIVKLTGEELEVECKVIGIPQPKVRWENEDGHIVMTTNGVLKLLDYVKHYSTYFKCHAESYVGSASRSTAMEYQQDLIFPNKIVQLLCPLRAINNVKWYKDNELIGKSSPQFNTLDVIMEFAKPDAYNYSGIYRCKTGRKEFHFNVTMTIPPSIETLEVTVDGIETSLENDEITVRLGQAVTVRCLVNGHPPPRVYWRTKRHHLGNDSSLHLPSIAKKHAGIYNCFAKLEAIGKEKRQININVLS